MTNQSPEKPKWQKRLLAEAYRFFAFMVWIAVAVIVVFWLTSGSTLF